ncbi:MAG: diguanylate cyclase, partial [Gammaproteobacteria bacterium]
REGDADLERRHGEMQWVPRINRALEEDRFELFAQPIVPINGATDEGDHYEILLRMRDENGQLVAPGRFLPAAERFNLSTRIDRWVIDATFHWLNEHPEKLRRLSLCSINLSGLSLGNEEFMGAIVRRLDEGTLPAHVICFEITETAAIANLASATNFIHCLRERGCRFSLDDFGTGLSSFAYLKNLPVDFLKIDGGFVKSISYDAIDLAMVRSINDIGHTMGKKTIAEFVEDDLILERLREIGVDYAQGYGVGRPGPLDKMD